MGFTFERFYLACLSHASYLVGSEGIAAVIDPQRDVDVYLQTAAERGLEIRHVIETHLHADFVSGHLELAERIGARIHIGERAGARFAHMPVRDGDELRFGRAVLKFLETPGHTLESICILVTDLDRSPDPFAILTGDTLFIGDVGRPDVSPGRAPQELAGMLYDSLHRKLWPLPDHIEVYPAHGAGSLCGRAISSERKSTIGVERATNYAFRAPDRESFIELVTADLPQRPAYFLNDVELNRAGARALRNLGPLPALDAEVVLRLQRSGAIVLDTRPAADFCAAHAPRSIQIGLSGQYASWAGVLLPWDATIVLVAAGEGAASESRMRLARVGLEGVAGYLGGGIAGWVSAGLPVTQIAQISGEELHRRMRAEPDLQTLDVRTSAEWQNGYVPGAMHKPLHSLKNILGGLNPAQPTAVYCKSGYRSTIAASLLQASGFDQVMNVTGGFDGWRLCGLPVEFPGTASSGSPASS